MFQKTDSTATTRIAILSLLATFIIALSGCGSLWTKTDSEHDRFVTGGYQGQDNKTLAVLLPESGRFAGAAKVVRAGVIAAQKAGPEEKWPKLRPYGATEQENTAPLQHRKKGEAQHQCCLQYPLVQHSEQRKNMLLQTIAH